MSLYSTRLFGPIVFRSLAVGFFLFVLSYLCIQKDLPAEWVTATALGLYFLSFCGLLWWKWNRPLSLILREMKALLTGQKYRRLMTEQKNEIGVLAHFFNEVTRNLEKISGDIQSHERMKKELNLAQKIQYDLLPHTLPSLPDLDVVAKTRPASEIGGDTFDFVVQKDRVIFYVGDSTGHGVPAGLVMIMVDTLIKTFFDMFVSLKDIMINLNKYLKPHLQTTMFMTMILGEWLPLEKKIKWVGAGHEYLVHYKTTTQSLHSYPAGGIAVGMLADNTALVKEQEITLEENDFLVMYSDGITEAKNVLGEIYDLKRLEQLISTQATTGMSARDLFDRIAGDVGRFMDGQAQGDDMTLIVLKHSSTVQNQDKSTEWSNS